MSLSGTRIGVIAGSGHLPLHIARNLSRAGKNVYVAGLRGTTEPLLLSQEWEIGWYEPYALRKLLDGLKESKVKQVVLAGRVGHPEIYRTGEFDDLLMTFLDSLEDQRPATILGGLVDLISRNGFEVLPLTEVAPDLLPAAGRMAGPPVKKERVADIKFGWRAARVIADQDIGQTVVVKGGAVVAVEAMEGTDRTIERAGAVSGGGFTVAKLAATDHDFRYDIPTVGPETVNKVCEAGGDLIVVEAGRCFILNRDQVCGLCAEKGVTLLAGLETGRGEVNWPDGS